MSAENWKQPKELFCDIHTVHVIKEGEKLHNPAGSKYIMCAI
jgi:hypothetical protein